MEGIMCEHFEYWTQFISNTHTDKHKRAHYTNIHIHTYTQRDKMSTDHFFVMKKKTSKI